MADLEKVSAQIEGIEARIVKALDAGEKVLEFDKQLKAAGFTVVSTGTAGAHTLSATKGNEAIAINAKPANTGTAFNISYTARP